MLYLSREIGITKLYFKKCIILHIIDLEFTKITEELPRLLVFCLIDKEILLILTNVSH